MAQRCGVRLENVSKTYLRGKEAVKALNQVNLTVESGEFLSVMGAKVHPAPRGGRPG